MIRPKPTTPSVLQEPAAPRRGRQNTGMQRSFVLMTLPALALLLVFAYLPMIGTVIAFKDFRAINGVFGSAWVGLRNFAFLFSSGDVLRATFNTLFLNSLFIITGTLTALGLALLLNELKGRGRFAQWLTGVYRSTLFFPFFISWVIVGYFTFALLNGETGLINRTLQALHLQPISWYASPQYWPALLVVVNLWKNVGYGTVIYLSGMLTIDTQYYEAAEIDGATKWQQIRFVTVPFIAPIITITVLLNIGRIFFADFGLFYNVTRDSSLLYPTTDVIDTYVFRALRQLGDFGMAGAAGLYQSVVGMVLVVLCNWIVRRRDPASSLF